MCLHGTETWPSPVGKPLDGKALFLYLTDRSICIVFISALCQFVEYVQLPLMSEFVGLFVFGVFSNPGARHSGRVSVRSSGWSVLVAEMLWSQSQWQLA